MAFEDLLVALRDDQLSKLRCQKPLQSPDAPQFLDLRGDARFEAAVQLRHLVGALTQFTKEPRILHRDHRLRREVLQQFNLLVGERPDVATIDHEMAERGFFLAQRHGEERTHPAKVDQRPGRRVARAVTLASWNISEVDDMFSVNKALLGGTQGMRTRSQEIRV